MPKVMQLNSLRNKTSRNAFDLTTRNCFTAKVGELLPVLTKEVIPGDRFDIDLRTFTRTQPVQTAAYTQIKEYYDFFFVPNSQLWHNWPAFITNLGSDASQKAKSLSTKASIGTQMPFFTSHDLFALILTADHADPNTNYNDILGFRRTYQWCKLLDYLGYGDYYNLLNNDLSLRPTSSSTALNPFPLLAYQKIYQDFYRNSQWETSRPYDYNLDFINDTNLNYLQLDLETYFGNGDPYLANQKLTASSIFDLRYCDWEKDYFNGLYPNSQIGDVAIASPISGTTQLFSIFDEQLDDDSPILNNHLVNLFPAQNDPNPSLGLSALALRQAEFLQRWKEIALTGSKDYKDQMEKHWGVKMSNESSRLVQFLGGVQTTLNINEVVNQNLSGENSSTIAGKGISISNGHISFESKEHGILMCIYHAVPLLQYATNGRDRLLTKTKVTDFAIPEFDKLGFQPIFSDELINYENSRELQHSFNPTLIGYAPRYIEYKTSIDKVHGEFLYSMGHWVAPRTQSFVEEYLNSTLNHLDYRFFKCDPRVLDSIFLRAATEDTDSDQLLINADFDIKAVRNLDYNGLPY